MDIYNETLNYLYNRLATFHRTGSGAFHPGVETTKALAHEFGDPHKKLRCIHVGGTNGKGSVTHTLAAVLQCAGYKTGLYTSPHLVDFAERIRIDGKCIPHNNVIGFVDRFRQLENNIDPSFFELATVMAFWHFASNKTDVAVIEVGLGGRLDSTNIINSDITVVTNISPDHKAILGDTLSDIAREKAGIFKPSAPALVGEYGEVRTVFEKAAKLADTSLTFAEDEPEVIEASSDEMTLKLRTRSFGSLEYALAGDCQVKNANTILHAIKILRKSGYKIPDEAVRKGFDSVCSLTGLMGRWQQTGVSPRIVCDTGHNPGAWQYLGPTLAKIVAQGSRLHIVLGFVNDKDIATIAQFLPLNATYYFVKPSTPRAAMAQDVANTFASYGIHGTVHGTVAEGARCAVRNAQPRDTIFVGGSTFVVADYLAAANLA